MASLIPACCCVAGGGTQNYKLLSCADGLWHDNLLMSQADATGHTSTEAFKIDGVCYHLGLLTSLPGSVVNAALGTWYANCDVDQCCVCDVAAMPSSVAVTLNFTCPGGATFSVGVVLNRDGGGCTFGFGGTGCGGGFVEATGSFCGDPDGQVCVNLNGIVFSASPSFCGFELNVSLNLPASCGIVFLIQKSGKTPQGVYPSTGPVAGSDPCASGSSVSAVVA